MKYSPHRDLLVKLLYIQAIRFGSFPLKGGLLSPFYIDLRLAISYPKLLSALAKALYQKVRPCSFDLICPVPYAALPLATAFSLQRNIPMLFCRKEKKTYGMQKQIEGAFQKGQTCLILEDVMVSGQSILETIAPLEKEGLTVLDVVVFVDRRQGGKERIEKKGYRLHALYTIHSILEILREEKKIDEKTATQVLHFLAEQERLR